MTKLPTGTITFLFTDIERSTTLWERDPAAMKAALSRHNHLLQTAIEEHGGRVFKIIGDSFQAAFRYAPGALAAALSAQRALLAEPWRPSVPLRVRMGLHAGPAEVQGDDYAVSHTLNRVARVMSAGHGGQILISLAAAELVREHLPDGVELLDLGLHHLKGLTQPERIFQLAAPDLPRDFPALQTSRTKPVRPPARPLPLHMVHGRVVGRQNELTGMVSAWQNAASGKGGVMLLSGEAGMGKTRLVGELANRVLQEGALILLGECFAEGNAPLTPFAEILRGLLGNPADIQPEGHWLQGLEAAALDILELVPEYLPYFINLPHSPALAPDVQRRRLFEAFAILLGSLAAESPVLVIIDDLHWADESSLSLIQHLARRLANHPVLIATTARTAEVNPALARMLTNLGRSRQLYEIHLKPLSGPAVTEIIRTLTEAPSYPDPEFLKALLAKTDGNPFFIEELVKAVIESAGQSGWTRATLEAVGVPGSVRETIGWHLDNLSEPGWAVATRGAVIGRRFDHDFLRAVIELDEGTLLEGLHSLTRTKTIIEETSAGSVGYGFRHPLIHEVIYNRMLAVERRSLHAVVAEELERRSGFDDTRLLDLRNTLPHHWWGQHKSDGVPPEVDQLAHHFQLAGNHSKAFQFTLLAAERNLAIFDPRAALQSSESALELLSVGQLTPAPADIIDLHLVRLTAHWLIGEYKAALNDGEAALTQAREQGDWQREAAALHFQSHTRLDQGRYGESIHLAQKALAIVEQHDDLPGIAHILLNLGEATITGVRGKAEEGLAYLARARPICEAIGDRLGLAHIELEEGHLKFIRGEYSEAADHLEKAIALSRELRDYTALTRSLNYLGIVQRDQGHYDASLATLEDALQSSEAGYIETQTAFALALISSVHLLKGDIQPALETALRSVELLEAIQANSLLPFALAMLGDVYRELGDRDRALVCFERALPIAQEVQDPCWESFALAGRGLNSLPGEDPETAIQDLHTAFSVCQRTKDIYMRATVQALVRLAAGHLAAGQPDEVIRFAGEAAGMAEAASICDLTAESRRILGLAYAHLEQWSAAETELQSAAQIAAAQDLPTIEWRTHQALGDIYHRQGIEELASQEFSQAASILTKISQQVTGEELRRSFLTDPDVQSMLKRADRG